MEEVVNEVPGFIQVLSDGTIKRSTPDIEIVRHEPGGAPPSSSPPSPQIAPAAFDTKDVVIDAAKPISARIFIPSDAGETAASQFPLLVYFHGGGFCIGSTIWRGYHTFLAGLCAETRCFIVSVDYRLAPEHRLPAAYEDCYAALRWLTEPVNKPLLAAADLSRVFLAGESAGGNIVHHMALRLVKEPLRGLRLSGLLVIHPFFGGEDRMAEEVGDLARAWLDVTDTMWRLSLPLGADRDHPFCRFENAEVSDEEWRSYPRVAVFLAGKDLLRPRGAHYAAFLQSKGAAEVTVVTAEGEVHAHHVFFPQSKATRSLQSQIAEFVHARGERQVDVIASKC